MDKDVFTDDVIGYGEWDFSNVAWDSYEHKCIIIFLLRVYSPDLQEQAGWQALHFYQAGA